MGQTNTELREMYERGEFRGYPDTLDLASYVTDHGVPEGSIDFSKFHAAYEELRDLISSHHWKGKHTFRIESSRVKTLAECNEHETQAVFHFLNRKASTKPK